MLDAMSALNPNVAPVVTIEGAAHGMHRENAPAFNAAVRDFIAQHEAAQPPPTVPSAPTP
jgi:pimeloyl-ACP methyl ester carboxylesterase